MKKAVKMIESAKKPVILCGHGVMMSGAEEVLQHFAVKTNTPVAVITSYSIHYTKLYDPSIAENEAYYK